tara:strand:+ start:31618 stop:31821 length:204 start_codon:yes stop_codon:yes gene_type:complete
MSPEEANNLMQVMNNKINQLTQQNMLLESKVMTLTSMIEQMKQNESGDGGNFDDTPPVKQNNGKTKQ